MSTRMRRGQPRPHHPADPPNPAPVPAHEKQHAFPLGGLSRLLTVAMLAFVLIFAFRPTAYQVVEASDPVIAAAGDIACDPGVSTYHSGNGTSTSCRQKYTSNLLVNTGLTAVLPLGDTQYYCGGYSAFEKVYDPTWGRVLSMTHPVIGNHEYLTSGGTGCGSSASGYFQYFGSNAGPSGKGYYSYDIGAWHIIALNSNCSKVGGCGSGSPQYTWLKNDLASHSNLCTLAYWHHPLFSSGGYTLSSVKSFWNLLYQYHADVVLNGHAHIYERFAPQTPSATADSHGIREFIVGTGGANHTYLATTARNSQVRNNNTFGVLRITLHSGSYAWKFNPESGASFTDSGSTSCH
jgi:acid phosphatase type 7